MDSTWRIALNQSFTLEQFDNEILLYSMDDTRAVYLNDTAFVVYSLCGSEQTVGSIVALLTAAYPEQKETIRQDVHETIEELADNGVILLNG